MKNIKTKKLIALLLSATLLILTLGGCASSDNQSDKFTVGIIQYGSHPSLDNCYEGVIKALDESGYNIETDLQNGNFDTATCDTIAKNMVSKNYDAIIAIATPAATSAYAAAYNSNIPVVFCAVSDPVAAGLVDSQEVPGGNCTGTSDILDFEAQLNLIKALQSDAKTVGILYTTSEANSVSQLKQFTEAAKAFGIEVVSQGVQTAADIPQAAASLCPKVDCLNNFTDNNVVNNLSIVLEQANAFGIPVYGSEEEQVVNGCIASVSIDYVALGKATGEMAIEILSGADAASMPVKTITDATPIINKEVCDNFGINIPEDYLNDQNIL